MAKRANVQLRIDAEDADAVRSFLKLTQAERNLELQTKKTSNAMKRNEQASKKASGEMLGLSKNALKAGVSMVGIGSAAMAFSQVTREIERMDRALIESAKRSNQQSRGLREFAALQAPGPEGRKHLRETLLQGAKGGMMPDPAANLAQPIQSMADANGDGRLSGPEKKQFQEDYAAALGLVEATVTPENALDIIGAARARGRGGREGADVLIKAATTSKQGPGVFAASIANMTQFSSLEEGMSVLSALTKEEAPDRLPAAMDRLGLVLGASGEVGQFKAFSDKYKLGGLTETQKLAALRQHAIESGDQSLSERARVKAFTDLLSDEQGLSAELSKNLGMAIRQSLGAESTRQILEKAAGGALAAALKAGMEDPITRGGILADRQRGLAAYGDMAGPQAEEAQKRLARRQILGAEALAEGDVANVTPEGELKDWSEWTWSKFLGDLFSGNRSSTVGPGGARSVIDVERENRAIQERIPASHEGVMKRQADLAAGFEAGINASTGGAYGELSYRGPAIDSPGDFAPLGAAKPGMGRNFGEIGRATPGMRPPGTRARGFVTDDAGQVVELIGAVRENTEAVRGNSRANVGRAPVGGNPANYEEAR